MKTKQWLMIGMLVPGLSLGTAPMLMAEEEGEVAEHEHHDGEEEEEDDEDEAVPYPSSKDTLAFLKEQVPVAVELLDIIKADEGEDESEEVLGEFRDEYHDYLLIRFHDGQEAASLALSRFRIELRMDKVLHEYFSREDEEGDEAGEDYQEQIRILVRELLEQEKRSVRMEIKLLARHREELEAELKSLDQIGEDEIEAEMREILELDEEEEEGEDHDEESEDK